MFLLYYFISVNSSFMEIQIYIFNDNVNKMNSSYNIKDLENNLIDDESDDSNDNIFINFHNNSSIEDYRKKMDEEVEEFIRKKRAFFRKGIYLMIPLTILVFVQIFFMNNILYNINVNLSSCLIIPYLSLVYKEEYDGQWESYFFRIFFILISFFYAFPFMYFYTDTLYLEIGSFISLTVIATINVILTMGY